MIPKDKQYTFGAQVIKNEPLLKSMVVRRNFEQLQHSKLIDAFRQCDRCPLGEKEKVVQQGKQQIPIKIPATCSYYKKGNKDCPVDKTLYIISLKEYYDVVDTPEYMEEMGKFLMKNAVSDAAMTRDIETIQKGYPGFMTMKHSENAIKVYDSIVKFKIGSDKHLHVHQQNDLTEQMLKESFAMPEAVPEEKKEDIKQKKLCDFSGLEFK
mgnify:CR=1 FL=1